MNEFLSSIKSDLLSRRMLPWLALVAVGLVAAVAYLVTSGGSNSPSTPSASAPSVTTPTSGTLPVSVASANPNSATSETPGGTRYQSPGSSRDPFKPLPETAPEKTKTAAATSITSGSSGNGSTSGGSSSGSSSSGSSSGGTGTTPTEKSSTPSQPTEPAKPSKPEFPYGVSVELGLVAPNSEKSTSMKTFKDLEPGRRLPSKDDARVSFQRVSSSATSAVFELEVPPILHGPASCLPSDSECQEIALAIGKTEVLEYIEESGQVVAYELKVTAIDKRHKGADAARVARSARIATR
jgi:hypothetical protein